MTTTEIIMNLAVWGLLLAGLFFGLRARRRKRGKPSETADDHAPGHRKIDQKP